MMIHNLSSIVPIWEAKAGKDKGNKVEKHLNFLGELRIRIRYRFAWETSEKMKLMRKSNGNLKEQITIEIHMRHQFEILIGTIWII